MGTFDLKDFLLKSKITLDRLNLKIWEYQKQEFEQIKVDIEDVRDLLTKIWYNGYIPYLLQGTVMSTQSKNLVLECTTRDYALLSYVLPSIFTLSVNDVVRGKDSVKALISVNAHDAKYVSTCWSDYQYRFFEVYRNIMGMLLLTASNCKTVDLQELNYTPVEDICLCLAKHCMSKITRGADSLSLKTPMSKELFDRLFEELSDFVSCEEYNRATYSSLEIRVNLEE